MRDMQKIVNATKIPQGYYLSNEEFKKLFFMCKECDDGTWEAIWTTFRYAFALGRKCEKNQTKKENRQRKEC